MKNASQKLYQMKHKVNHTRGQVFQSSSLLQSLKKTLKNSSRELEQIFFVWRLHQKSAKTVEGKELSKYLKIFLDSIANYHSSMILKVDKFESKIENYNSIIETAVLELDFQIAKTENELLNISNKKKIVIAEQNKFNKMLDQEMREKLRICLDRQLNLSKGDKKVQRNERILDGHPFSKFMQDFEMELVKIGSEEESIESKNKKFLGKIEKYLQESMQSLKSFDYHIMLDVSRRSSERYSSQLSGNAEQQNLMAD